MIPHRKCLVYSHSVQGRPLRRCLRRIDRLSYTGKNESGNRDGKESSAEKERIYDRDFSVELGVLLGTRRWQP